MQEPEIASSETYCAQCGRLLPTLVTFGDENLSLTLEDDSSMTCACGHVNPAGGTYTARRFGGKLRVLVDGMNPEELRAVRNSLREAMASNAPKTIETLAEQLQGTSPSIAQWLRGMVNDNQGVIAIIALLYMIVDSILKGHTPPAQQTTINQNITVIEQGQTIEAPYPRRRPCPCGSGKLFKNCHDRRPGVGAAVDSPTGWG